MAAYIYKWGAPHRRMAAFLYTKYEYALANLGDCSIIRTDGKYPPNRLCG